MGINPATGEIDCKMNYDPKYDPYSYDYVYGGFSWYDEQPGNEMPLIGAPGIVFFKHFR